MIQKSIQKTAQKTQSIVAAAFGLAFLFISNMAVAQGLPDLEAPSRGEGEGLIATLQNYAYDFAILIGLIIATVAFLVVATGSIATFNEARLRGEWSKFAIVVVVGVVLIVCIIWLATKAAEIL